MATYNLSGKKIDHIPYSVTCGLVAQAGMFTDLSKITTITGTMEPSASMSIGNIDKYLVVTLMFDSSEKNVKESEEPAVIVRATMTSESEFPIVKMGILGTKLEDVTLTNATSRKIVYNISFS